MKRLDGLVMGDSCTKHYPSVRHIYANCPSDAVQAILQILELRAVTKQMQIDGDACSTNSAQESRDISPPKNRSKARKPDQI